MRHLAYYISLATIFTIGIIVVQSLRSQKELQIAVIILLCIFYVLWGVVHHIVLHSFSLKVMLEYIAIAVFGVSLILFIYNIGL